MLAWATLGPSLVRPPSLGCNIPIVAFSGQSFISHEPASISNYTSSDVPRDSESPVVTVLQTVVERAASMKALNSNYMSSDIPRDLEGPVVAAVQAVVERTPPEKS